MTTSYWPCKGLSGAPCGAFNGPRDPRCHRCQRSWQETASKLIVPGVTPGTTANRRSASRSASRKPNAERTSRGGAGIPKTVSDAIRDAGRTEAAAPTTAPQPHALPPPPPPTATNIEQIAQHRAWLTQLEAARRGFAENETHPRLQTLAKNLDSEITACKLSFLSLQPVPAHLATLRKQLNEVEGRRDADGSSSTKINTIT